MKSLLLYLLLGNLFYFSHFLVQVHQRCARRKLQKARPFFLILQSVFLMKLAEPTWWHSTLVLTNVLYNYSQNIHSHIFLLANTLRLIQSVPIHRTSVIRNTQELVSYMYQTFCTPEPRLRDKMSVIRNSQKLVSYTGQLFCLVHQRLV